MPRRYEETMAAYCCAAAAVRDADELLREEGLTVSDGRSGTRRHPAVAIRSQGLQQVRLLADALGLSPASASRLPRSESPEKPNPFAELKKI